jgi:hypothetical protein
MGSPEKLFSSKQIKKLTKTERNKLAREITRHLKTNLRASLKSNLKKKYPGIIAKM